MGSLEVSRSIGSEIRRLEDNFLEFDRQQRRRQQVRNIKNTLSLLLLLMVFYLLMLPIFVAGIFPTQTQEKIAVYHGQVAVQLPIPVVTRYSGV